MPGILPMKMIRVGGNTQSRIAQACDRCRSKKIRCDGVRPCCTQCANVGFECKTSDKLSRRAFPRGYTESLEDRVRGLEAEVRELKDLLDERDEKIDVLSRLHDFSPQSRKNSMSPKAVLSTKPEAESPPSDTILVEIPAAVQATVSSTGTSTTAALIEAFEEKVQSSGRPCPAISSSSLLKSSSIAVKASAANIPTNVVSSPPRLLSDQYINLFFQEWQPMLPILHRPSFLRIYEQYLADSKSESFQTNKHATAQLFLIFEIAAYSSSSKTKPTTTSYEIQWRKALSALSSTPAVATVQSHILAQLCYLLKSDHSHLLRHRAYSISMIHQLGLHQSHKCHPLPPFEAETRKKVFWCQYVLDKYASAVTGTPQLLRDSDITIEYPMDIDDENISPQGISPALPGELTKISSALAFFRSARILSKTIDYLYPAKASYQLSLTKLHSLSDELDQWQEELPDHLRLRFHNDKPATNLISCRSPLLSLAYFYTRSLIHRPLLCFGSGSSASAATIILAAAAKHELQILDLLDERSMNYTFPIGKQDILLNTGFSVLWQTLTLEKDSKIVKDNLKSLALMASKLIKENRSVCIEFQKIVASIIPLSSPRPSSQTPEVEHLNLANPQSVSTSSQEKQKSTRKQLQAIAARLSSAASKPKAENEHKSVANIRSKAVHLASPYHRTNSTISLPSTSSAPISPAPYLNSPTINRCPETASAINLDYFPFQIDPYEGPTATASPSAMLPPRKKSHNAGGPSHWDRFAGDNNSQSPEMFNATTPTCWNGSIANSAHNTNCDWTDDLWRMPNFDLTVPRAAVPQSLLSFSDESLTSADDLVFSAPGSLNGSMSTPDAALESLAAATVPDHGIDEDAFEGIIMPVSAEDYDYHDDEA